MPARRTFVTRVVAVAVAALVAVPLAACDTGPTPPPAAAIACDDLGLLPCPRQVAYAALPIAGSAFRLMYASDRVPGRTGDAAPPVAPVGLGGWTLDVLDTLDPATRRLVTGTGRLRAVTPVGVAIGEGRWAVAAVDGATVDVFDAAGRVVAVYDGVTGAPRLTFTWSGHGLDGVTARSGATLTVVRDDAGNPLRLDSSQGPRTALRVQEGALAEVGYPDGGIARLATGVGGLLTGWSDPTTGTTTYAYDGAGRLTSSTNGTGATTTYQGSADSTSATVTSTGPTGAVGRDTVEATDGAVVRTHVDAAGDTTRLTARGNQRVLDLPAGRTVTIELAPDPRWGMDAPVTAAVSGGGATIREERSGGDPAHPDAAQPTQTTITVDGAQWTFGYDPQRRVATRTDPAGRTTESTFDPAGRLTGRTTPGSAAEAYDYDDRGRLTAAHLGSGDQQRTWTYGIEPDRTTVRGPLGATQVRTFSATGALAGTAGPGTQGVSLTTDTAGRLTGYAVPGRVGHRLTRRADGQVAAFTAPAGAGGIGFTTYAYDPAGLLTGVSWPDGAQTITRDPAGRVTAVDSGAGAWQLTYDRGLLTGATGPGAGSAFTYDAGRLVEQRTEGPFAVAVRRTLDPLGRVATETVDGAPPVGYTYDQAGLLTAAGNLTVERDPATGAVTRETLGSVVRTWAYDAFGAPVRETVTRADGSPVAELGWERDALGRVVVETVTTGPGTTGGGVGRTAYTYDDAGRLTTVDRLGQVTRYGYDDAGNRTSVTAPDGTVTTAAYDARNALVEQGGVRYAYDGAGRLATATQGADVTTYRYDRAGALLAVERPQAAPVTYVNDVFGRRVSRAVGDTVTGGFVYGDRLGPAAEVDAAGAVTARYVYGDAQSPLYVTKGDTDFLEVVDATGSPVLAVDAGDGTVHGAVTRDPWGVAAGPDPGFQALGFAGGIADPDTGLVRFGARDYAPGTGRWTAPDPIGVYGGSANLYSYVSGDPVNRTDPAGTCEIFSIGISAGIALGPFGYRIGWGIAGTRTQLGGYTSGGAAWGAGEHLTLDATCSRRWSPDGSDATLDMFSGRSDIVDIGLGAGALHGEWDRTTGGLGVSLGEGAGVEVGEEDTSVYCWAGCPEDYDDATLDELLREAEALADCRGALGCDTGPPDPPGPGSDPFGPNPAAGAAGSHGEPHLVTVDGLRYDMHGIGEYVAIAADTGDLEIQVRQQPVPGSRTYSMNTAVAIRAGGDRLTVAPVGTNGIAVRVEGGPPAATGTTTLPGGATLRVGDSAAAVSLPDGSAIGVSRNPLALDFGVELADTRKGHVHGLLGPFGVRDGRVEARDGTAVEFADLADRDGLYRRFSDTWRITQEQSLFDYAPGETTATITDLTYPDPAPPLPEATRAAAEQVCRHVGVPDEMVPACVLDVAATGEAGFADSAVAASGTLPGAPPPPDPIQSGTRVADGATVSGRIEPGGAPVRYDLDLAGADGVVVADWAGPIGGCDQVFSVNLVGVSGNNLPCTGGAVPFGSLDPGRPYQLEIAPVGPDGGSYSFTVVTVKVRTSDITLGPERHTGRLDARGRIDRFVFAAAGAAAIRLTELPAQCRPGLLVEVFDAATNVFVAARPACGTVDPIPLPDPNGRYALQIRSDALTTADYTFAVAPN